MEAEKDKAEAVEAAKAEAESDNMCASRPFTISPQTIPLSGTSSMTSQSLGGGSMPIGADEEQSLTSHNSDKARLVVC